MQWPLATNYQMQHEEEDAVRLLAAQGFATAEELIRFRPTADVLRDYGISSERVRTKILRAVERARRRARSRTRQMSPRALHVSRESILLLRAKEAARRRRFRREAHGAHT